MLFDAPWKIVRSGTGQPDSAKRHPDTGEPWQEPERIEDSRGRIMARVGYYFGVMAPDRTAPGFDGWLAEKEKLARLLRMAPHMHALLTAAAGFLADQPFTSAGSGLEDGIRDVLAEIDTGEEPAPPSTKGRDFAGFLNSLIIDKPAG